MSGKLLVGIAVGAMIMGPYRITADQKKVERPTVVKKTEMKETPKKEEPKPENRFVRSSR
ncbi:hypothetical protein L0244_35775 [bacterium]|nr:hypothetical protein [bacterium]